MQYNRLVFALLLVVAILVGILVWGLLIWLLVRSLFLALSGWNKLARLYRAPQTLQTWHWYGQTVKIGAVRYRRSIQVAALPDGLYLAESGLLRHPPLRIPWPEITGTRPARFYGRPSVAVTVGTPPIATLEFPAELYNAIHSAASHG